MRTPRTDIPGLIVRTTPTGNRIAFLAADLDRRFGRDNLPDHGDLLANLVRWAAGDAIPLTVKGKGFIDCHLYRQPGRMILHLVNLTNAATARAPVHELISVGPLTVRVKLVADVPGRHKRRLVAREEVRDRSRGRLGLRSRSPHSWITRSWSSPEGAGARAATTTGRANRAAVPSSRRAAGSIGLAWVAPAFAINWAWFATPITAVETGSPRE